MIEVLVILFLLCLSGNSKSSSKQRTIYVKPGKPARKTKEQEEL